MTADARNPEHLDVLIVGAGLSGIGAGHYLQAQCRWASWAIFEARDAIGGTWDLFRYPGVRSDSDMFTLGYAFRPWDGAKAIADGASILAYIQDTAAAAGIGGRIRFGHRVVRAAWSSDEARWHVTAQRTDTGEVVEVTCGFLFCCTGYYRYDHGYVPDFAGMDRFAGTIVHPQAWPSDLSCNGQRVLVIGSGATAVTLVPALAATAGHVTMVQRSPSYVASMPARDPIADALRRALPRRLTYKGMMVEGVPNLAVAVGYPNASWTLKCDLTCGYVCRLVNHLRATGMRQATPVNRAPAVSTRPLLDLTSGYIQRSAHRFPKQGSRFPWQIQQSYLRDYRSLKLSGIEDDAMVFSNPVREKAAAGSTAG